MDCKKLDCWDVSSNVGIVLDYCGEERQFPNHQPIYIQPSHMVWGSHYNTSVKCWN